MNFEKIDGALFDVSVLENKKAQNCVVFVKDFKKSKIKIKELFGESVILFEYPFLNAFGVSLESKSLDILSRFDFIEYVSSIKKANILLYNSRKFLKINQLHKKGILGAGTTVAVIDTGIKSHLDFVLGRNRIVCFKDFLNGKHYPYDDNGHGTFVSGVLAGSGIVEDGKFRGVAPGANLVVLKALDKKGETQVLTILSAMQWVVDNAKRYNIRVVCMSFGSTPQGENDPLILGAKVLWENGIVVVCAAGNDGPNENTIKSPGACPNVITVGSLDNLKDLELKIAPFSSRGPAFDFVKPEVIAPGVDIISTGLKDFYTTMSGTSVSTPFVAGLCALMISEHPKLTPNLVKSLIINNATKICSDENECGNGIINPELTI